MKPPKNTPPLRVIAKKITAKANPVQKPVNVQAAAQKGEMLLKNQAMFKTSEFTEWE